ncbi:hypothetical protein GCM10028791_18430 [Echinicola sediminis]
MKRPLDRINELYLIPAVLSTGLLFMGMLLYYFHQWSQVNPLAKTPGIEIKGMTCLLLSFMTFAVLRRKKRPLSVLHLTLSLLGLIYIFY